jgi:hypothetical protein
MDCSTRKGEKAKSNNMNKKIIIVKLIILKKARNNKEKFSYLSKSSGLVLLWSNPGILAYVGKCVIPHVGQF